VSDEIQSARQEANRAIQAYVQSLQAFDAKLLEATQLLGQLSNLDEAWDITEHYGGPHIDMIGAIAIMRREAQRWVPRV
jgi:hypothetical protein